MEGRTRNGKFAVGHKLSTGPRDWAYGSQMDRFMDRVEVGPIHWMWIGLTVRGYGRYDHKRAHRWAYEIFKGPIPADHDIHHTCGIRLCVNPEHLECIDIHEHRRKKGGDTLPWQQQREEEEQQVKQ
jgi:hypothetical protein